MKTITCASLPFPINVKSLEIDGLDPRDYPDFCDAYFCYGEREDGTPLTEVELETLTCEAGEELNDLCHEEMQGFQY